MHEYNMYWCLFRAQIMTQITQMTLNNMESFSWIYPDRDKSHLKENLPMKSHAIVQILANLDLNNPH